LRAASSGFHAGRITPHSSSAASASAARSIAFIVSMLTQISASFSWMCWKLSTAIVSTSNAARPSMSSLFAMFFTTTWWAMCTTAPVRA
jgi:hypothetical protein